MIILLKRPVINWGPQVVNCGKIPTLLQIRSFWSFEISIYKLKSFFVLFVCAFTLLHVIIFHFKFSLTKWATNKINTSYYW